METWGFDVYTYRMIIAYLKHPVDADEMNRFVSKTLPKAANAVKLDNWDIRNSLKLIIQN